jgi:hypothetical protein
VPSASGVVESLANGASPRGDFVRERDRDARESEQTRAVHPIRYVIAVFAAIQHHDRSAENHADEPDYPGPMPDSSDSPRTLFRRHRGAKTSPRRPPVARHVATMESHVRGCYLSFALNVLVVIAASGALLISIVKHEAPSCRMAEQRELTVHCGLRGGMTHVRSTAALWTVNKERSVPTSSRAPARRRQQ